MTDIAQAIYILPGLLFNIVQYIIIYYKNKILLSKQTNYFRFLMFIINFALITYYEKDSVLIN